MSTAPSAPAPNLTEAEQSIYDQSTSPLLDLSLVHQRAIPGIWNQVKFSTFPANWLVIGHAPGLAGRSKMMLQGEGPGGLRNAVALLRDDEVQYAGFRVSVSLRADGDSDGRGDGNVGDGHGAPPPNDVFVMLSWCGRHTTAQQRERLPEENEFMMQYFHGKDIDIALEGFSADDDDERDEKEGNETKGKPTSSLSSSSSQSVGRVGRIVDHLKSRIMDIVTHRADSSEQARNLRFDFANTGAVGMCTHYDYVEHGTSKEDEDASMTQDALQYYAAIRFWRILASLLGNPRKLEKDDSTSSAASGLRRSTGEAEPPPYDNILTLSFEDRAVFHIYHTVPLSPRFPLPPASRLPVCPFPPPRRLPLAVPNVAP